MRAVAVPLNRGRTTVTAQTTLHDSEQRLVAQTTQIQAVRLPLRRQELSGNEMAASEGSTGGLPLVVP